MRLSELLQIVAIVVEAERRPAKLRLTLTPVILRVRVIVFELGRVNDVLE